MGTPASPPKKNSIRKSSPVSAKAPDRPNNSLAACLECRSRKVKCSRELPKCSNCKRSGADCHFPNPEKKSSQTKQLAEDVATFNGRLSTLEQSLSYRMEVLTELVSQSIKDQSEPRTPSQRSPPQVTDEFIDSASDDDLNGTSRKQSMSKDLDNLHLSIIVNDGNIERFYGASSTYSHQMRSRALVAKLLRADGSPSASHSTSRRESKCNSPDVSSAIVDDPLLFAEVQRKYDSFSGPSNFKESFEIGDNKPLELPPRAALDEAIELYLSECSLEPPLFRKETLYGAVHEQYQLNSSDIDESWALCFNNIILRSTGWKSRTFRINSFATNGVDDNVLSLLLANANRALRQLEKFCGLRIVNVQALFLLALVARDFIHYNVFERIFDRVCQLAKQMGLHERGASGTSPPPDDSENQNILWVLYSVDKQRIFIRGPPCRIYLFECDIQLPNAEDTKQHLVRANLRLTCLIEEVYRQLYCPKANRQDVNVRQLRVERLDRRLEQLAQQLIPLFESAERGCDAQKTMGIQLRYALEVTKLLIHCRSMEERSKQLRLERARRALQIIQNLANGSFIFNGGIVVLERFFCNYSVIAFHEVFENLITNTGPDSSTDLSLLTTATNVLRLLSHPNRPYAYCTRLHKNFAWCTEIATLIYNARKRPSSQSSGGPASGGDYFDNGMHLDQFNFEKCENQSGNPPVEQISPSHDFEGDLSMNDSSSSLSSVPLSLTGSNFDRNDFNMQGPLNGDLGFNVDDFALGQKALGDPALFPMDVPSESSAEFQQMLQSMFDMGPGLDGNFQHFVAGNDMNGFSF